MKKFVKLKAAMLLAAAVNYAEAGCVPPASGQTPLDVFNCFQSIVDAQQKQIKALAVVNKAQQKLIKAQGEEIQALKREQVRLNKETQAALSLAEKHEAGDFKNVALRMKSLVVEERGLEVLSVYREACSGNCGNGIFIVNGVSFFPGMKDCANPYARPENRGHIWFNSSGIMMCKY